MTAATMARYPEASTLRELARAAAQGDDRARVRLLAALVGRLGRPDAHALAMDVPEDRMRLARILVEELLR